MYNSVSVFKMEIFYFHYLEKYNLDQSIHKKEISILKTDTLLYIRILHENYCIVWK